LAPIPSVGGEKDRRREDFSPPRDTQRDIYVCTLRGYAKSRVRYLPCELGKAALRPEVSICLLNWTAFPKADPVDHLTRSANASRFNAFQGRGQMQLRNPVSFALAALLWSSSPGFAQKKYDVGATDSEIKIGNTMAYSGPLSAYALIGRVEDAYFRKINDEGGVNGRKITFISYDDAYNPSKTVEQTRKLVESDEVLFIFGPLGTPTSNAVQKYLNQKHIPQLFIAAGATKFGDPENYPWSMGWQPTYQTEGHIFAKYLLEKYPNGKVAMLYQNDDSGKDYLKGLKDGLNG
jgi:ABC-type branched-subunit amino acid transport system substrate-binding protein